VVFSHSTPALSKGGDLCDAADTSCAWTAPTSGLQLCGLQVVLLPSSSVHSELSYLALLRSGCTAGGRFVRSSFGRLSAEVLCVALFRAT
jgi:hypothetical protein